LGKFAAFKLPLRGMEPGIHTFEYELDSEFFRNMESADIHKGNVKVELTVNCRSDYYELDFVLKGIVDIPCDRCLDEMEHEVDTTYHLCVKYGESFSDESDELLIIPESDNYLNIAYMLYDSVALTIPLKHVHPAGKCNRGMSEQLRKHSARKADEDDMDSADFDGDESIFSSDDDVAIEDDGEYKDQNDPRWDALKKLTDNN